MKAKLIRDEQAPQSQAGDNRVVRKTLEGKPNRLVWPAGTIIDNQDAWQLCRAGVATPADAECETALKERGITDAMMKAAQDAQARMRTELVDGIDVAKSDKESAE